MNLKRHFFTLLAVLFAMAQGVLAWDGSGTSDDPYLVKTTEDWNQISTQPDACYKLMQDIMVTSSPAYETDYAFTGIFDGNGHTITANIIEPDSPYAALFSYVAGATIRNLNVVGTIEGGNYTAGLVGIFANEGTPLIENCRVASNIKGNDERVAGFVGQANRNSLTIRGCLFEGTLNGSTYGAAFVAGASNPSALTITDCFENGSYKGFAHAGLNYDASGSATAIVTTGTFHRQSWSEGLRACAITSASENITLTFQEQTAYYSVSNLAPSGNGIRYKGIFYAPAGSTVNFTAANSAGALDAMLNSSGTLTGSNGNFALTLGDTDASLSVFELNGNGTEESPFLIRKTADWEQLAAYVNNGQAPEKAYYKLTGDISVNNAIGTIDHPFIGYFDGDSHTITCNLYSANEAVAPFAYIQNATIEHLKVDGNIAGALHTAGVVSYVTGSPNYIVDCHVSTDITGSMKNSMVVLGGIVGHATQSTLYIYGCRFDGHVTTKAVTDNSYAGAIVGWCDNATDIHVRDCAEDGTYNNIKHAGMNYTNGNPPSASAIDTRNSFSLSHDWEEVKCVHKVVSINDRLVPYFYGKDSTYPTSGIISYRPTVGDCGMKIDGTFYSVSGLTVCFDANDPDIEQSGNGILANNAELEWTVYYKFTMPDTDVYLSIVEPWQGTGSNTDPYIVDTPDKWQQLAWEVKKGNNYGGKYFRLTKDIDIYASVGGEDGDHAFYGNFDGNGHTLTAHLTGGECTAPFKRIRNATISHLHVTGDIEGGIHSAGIAGGATYNNLIEDCKVSASFKSTSTHLGGFIGHANESATIIRGCLFDGKVTSSTLNYFGAFFGWCNNPSSLTIEDCIAMDMKGSEFAHVEMSFQNSGTAACNTVKNSYSMPGYGYDNLGKEAKEVSTDRPVLRLNFKTTGDMQQPVTYATAGLTSYGTGLKLDGKFVAGQNETVTFQPQAHIGFTYQNLSADYGTLTHSGDNYSLKLGEHDAVITADINRTDVGSFSGSGTFEDPYLISNNVEWAMLCVDVAEGQTYSGKVFRMTNDIDAGNVMVGAEGKPFSGIFDGDNHTLTFNSGVEYNPVKTPVAPFLEVSGATIRHLKTNGTIWTKGKNAAGIISKVTGNAFTRLYNCHSTMEIQVNATTDDMHGGLVGRLNNGVDSLVIDRCSFTGVQHNNGILPWGVMTFGGFVGYSEAPLFIHYGFFDPSIPDVKATATFAHNKNSGELHLDNCYTTYKMFLPQGKFVVEGIDVPEGVTCEFVGEPDVNINGKGYYFNGCRIKLTLADGMLFKWWVGINGEFISDPWTANGIHQLKDLTRRPKLAINVFGSFPEAETERTLWGVTYRYLSRRDYHYYISTEDVDAKGWKFESNDADANLVVYDGNGKASEITAITGYDESDYNSDGVQIHNDLVGVFRNHTHLGLIAPHAFRNSSALKTMYFKDTDANNYNTLLDFDFFIDEGAFENCQNFTELKMMQYTTRGDNHWEDIKPSQVVRVADNAFDKCPKLYISVYRDDYRDYLASETWRAHRSRFIIYEATTEDIEEAGVYYHKYRTGNEENVLKNDENGKQEMGEIVQWWNADYQQFNAASLLDTYKGNVAYVSVIGVKDSEIDNKGGTMRIYNDPGSFYNYKTIALQRDAIKGNTHVKHIEFWQTAGRSENSFSDLKMVIPNGAFQNCTNLKELRMFYFVQDGNDHFVALGPTDVIPGDNIFGVPTLQEKAVMTEAEMAACPKIPEDFRILVAPEQYQDFLNDPNWKQYLGYIEPVDYSPYNNKTDYTQDGLKYSYMTNPGGILQTSQVVSQDVSWWTAPRIAIEVALIAYQVALRYAATGVELSTHLARSEAVNLQTEAATAFSTVQSAKNLALTSSVRLIPYLEDQALLRFANNFELREMIEMGFSEWAALEINNQPFQRLVDYGVAQVVEGGTKKLIFENAAWTALQGESRRFFQETLRGCFGFISNAKDALLPGLRASLEKATLNMYKKMLIDRFWTNMALEWAHPERMLTKIGIQAGLTTTATLISSACWGGTDQYNAEMMNKGMRENILSNIHQVGLVGGGYVITTPSKNLVFHTYIKEVNDNTTDAKIYAGKDVGSWESTRTMTFAKKAFRNKTNLKTIKFYENPDNLTSQEAMPMLFTIPDSAFVGCTNLTEFSTLLQTNGNGTRALGPENFILAGESIFEGLDSLKFHITIDPSRKDDYLASESWAPLQKYFRYERAVPEVNYTEYGVNYAYAYENNSIKKTHKVQGHLIEHLVVTAPNEKSDKFVKDHQGAIKLCNDIGVYNNYQLDAIMPAAFKGYKNLRTVSFTDLYGFMMTGDVYTGLDVTICDSAFVDCSNLANVDLLYMVTDGIPNHLDPMTPEMIKIGKGVFDGSPARLKMMPQQVAWFENDSTWAKYKDRFMPCVIRLTDPGIKKALKPMAYYDPANTGTDDAMWYDYGDLARIGGAGFSWLDGKFTAQKDNIYSFADFKWFQSVGLDYVGASWFEDCAQLGNIVLPSTIKTIKSKAFKGCASLKEIELPKGLTAIETNAFAGCSKLNTILVRDSVPATLGTSVFDKHDGLKIYVPAPRVSSYKSAWSEYAPYIVGDDTYTFSKVVTVTEVGQLAEKLGLTLKKEHNMVRYIIGNYAKYDSLTVIGPLNGEDLAVLRHMAGADAYDSDPTDGQMKYLNLWDARIKKDQVNSYNGNWIDEVIGDDDIVPRYLFENCKVIEEVIFPKAATQIKENMFEDATAIKRACIGKSTTFYDTDLLQDTNGIEEVVFLTDSFCHNDAFWWDDPWEAPIGIAYTLPSQLGDYMGDTKLTKRAQTVTAPLSEDAVMWALADHGHFFPSEYLEMKSAENIFNGNTAIKDFSDFRLFVNVRALENTFNGMTAMEKISLPDSIESISADAFAGCTALMEIHVSRDSVPTLAEDAFSDLPADFKIFVPKRLCKLYREKWAQYADHINPDVANEDEEIITVTLTVPNTLAEKLGLTMETTSFYGSGLYVNGVKGDYNKIRKIKVIGPISGGDLDVMRYLAGYCAWANCRNYAGRLEYIDLYDANLTDTDVQVKGYYNQATAFFSESMRLYNVLDNELPHHAFLRAYTLKTLILPRTCTKVEERALQECEGLETLVIGDGCTEFNWNALDDDAMLTRMYLLANQKVNITTQVGIWRWLCNNYNPTFDAFYVLPSLYEEYLNDDAYTGSSWQRTNNISKGAFEDDASFQVFASHAAATEDDLAQVYSVNGWFDTHPGVKDLTALEMTNVTELRTEDMQKLQNLEKVALPITLETLGDSLFAKSPNLRYVDMLMCDSTTIVDEIRARGFAKLGIDSLKTLVYVPSDYGTSDGTNIVVASGGGFHARKFRLIDDKDYCVPYPFDADAVENSRKLTGKNKAFAAFLPYDLTPDPSVVKVYKPVSLDGTVVTFEQVEDNSMEAFKPYVIRLTGKKGTLNVDEERYIPMSSDALVTSENEWQVPGYTMRGTLKRIGNKEASERHLLMLVDGEWVDVPSNKETAYIAPFRAYMLGSANSLGANGLSMEFVDTETTAIDTIRTVDSDGTERYYDLSGRELPGKPAKGVYIYKGKKYISK